MKQNEIVIGAVLFDGMNPDIRYQIVSVGLSAACVTSWRMEPVPGCPKLRRAVDYGPVLYDLRFLCKNFQSVNPVCQEDLEKPV